MRFTRCVRALAFAATVLGGNAPVHAQDAPGLAMVRAKMCTNCHGFGGRIVGPGWFDIAARRAGEAGAEAALALRIRLGSLGEWGSTPMPPMPVTEEEAMTMARWVLTRRREP